MKKELFELLKKHKVKLIVEGIAIILFVYFMTCPAKYLGKIIDLLYNMEENKKLILQNVAIMIGSALGIAISKFVFKNIDFRISMDTRKTLTDHLFKKFMKMRLEDIKLIRNGEIMSYFVRDTKKVASFLLRFYSISIRITGYVVMVIILIAQLSNIKLALCAIIPVFITMITLIFIRKNIKSSFTVAQKSFTEFSEFVQENTDSIRTVKAFSGERKEFECFEKKKKKLKMTI